MSTILEPATDARMRSIPQGADPYTRAMHYDATLEWMVAECFHNGMTWVVRGEHAARLLRARDEFRFLRWATPADLKPKARKAESVSENIYPDQYLHESTREAEAVEAEAGLSPQAGSGNETQARARR